MPECHCIVINCLKLYKLTCQRKGQTYLSHISSIFAGQILYYAWFVKRATIKKDNLSYISTSFHKLQIVSKTALCQELGCNLQFEILSM